MLVALIESISDILTDADVATSRRLLYCATIALGLNAPRGVDHALSEKKGV